jgi:hypothetical protein
MSKTNSSSLFHFTSRKDVLFKILQTGIRFSYCYESFGGRKGMAIPMICFCDIPLMRSLDHRSKYGDYAIGFNKEYLMSHSGGLLNPIQYVTSPLLLFGRNSYSDLIENQIGDGFNNILNSIFEEYSVDKIKEQEIQIVDKDLRYKLESFSIAKMFYRNQRAFSRHYQERIKDKIIINYNEREWRLVPYLNEADEAYPEWIEEITEEEFSQSKKIFTEAISNAAKSHILIPSSDINRAITAIVVKNEKMVRETITKIMKSNMLFGSIINNNEDKISLINKITSFERIENDY